MQATIDLPSTISDRRSSLGLSRSQAARRAGLSEDRWAELENGLRDLTGGERVAVAHSLATTVRSLTADRDIFEDLDVSDTGSRASGAYDREAFYLELERTLDMSAQRLAA